MGGVSPRRADDRETKKDASVSQSGSVERQEKETKGKRRRSRRTHHSPSVERVGSNGDDDVLSDSLEDLSTRDEETVVLESLLDLLLSPLGSFGGSTFSETFLVRDLLDGVRFSSGSRLITLDGVTSKENSVDLKTVKEKVREKSGDERRRKREGTNGNDLSGLEDGDISDENVLRTKKKEFGGQ